jgi:hypothetical protein
VETPEVTANWKGSWGRAMRELDTAKFALAVTAAETHMFRRYQDIAGSPDHVEERMQMSAALDDLLAAKFDRLNWRPAEDT